MSGELRRGREGLRVRYIYIERERKGERGREDERGVYY